MRKFYLFTLALLSAVGAWAQYTWNGGTKISADAWNTASNWTTSGTSTLPAGKSPGTPNSNCWDVINISNASGEAPTLEGWNLRMVLSNATLTADVNKIQNGGGNTCSFTLQNVSILNLNIPQPAVGGNTNDFNVDLSTGTGNTLNLNIAQNYKGVATVNYGTLSSDMNRQFRFSSTTDNNVTMGGLKVVATMPEATSAETKLNIVTLAKTTNASFTNKMYEINEGEFERLEGVLTADRSNIAKYSIVEENGEIKLYWVTGTATFANLTYKFRVNGNVVSTKTVKGVVGASYPVVSPSWPSTFRSSPEYYSVGGVPEGTVEGDGDVFIEITQHLPFEISADFANAKWYTMNINAEGYYLNYEADATQINLSRRTTSFDNADMFCFVGDIFNGFRIYNKAAGEGKLLSSVLSTNDGDKAKVYMVDKTTAETQGYLWDVTKSTNRGENGFYLGLHDYNGGKNRLNNRDGILSYWLNGADGGSTLKTSDVDGLFDSMKKAKKLSILDGSTVQGPSEIDRPKDINDAIVAAQSVKETYEAKKEFINSAEGQKINKYLNALATHGSLANIQFTMKEQYGTLIMPCPSSAVAGLKTYKCSAVDENNVVTLTPNVTNQGADGALEYNVPYIIEATPESKFTIIGWDKGSRGTHTQGYLTGVLTNDGANIPVNNTGSSYVLAKNKEGKVGFFKVTGNEVKCPQYKCYLTVPASVPESTARAFYFSSDDVETGINAVEIEEATPANAVIYDLSGRRVQSAKSGLYIVNGKKVIK